MLSVLLLPASYLLLHAWWPGFVQLRNVVPAFVIHLFCAELLNFPHHSDLFKFSRRLPLWEQWRAARSCHYPLMMSEVLVLNFNYHIEHHLYPSLPWYRLRSARTLVRAALGGDYHESIGIGWNLANRTRSIQSVVFSEAGPAAQGKAHPIPTQG